MFCCAACRQSARETNAHAAYEPLTRSARYRQQLSHRSTNLAAGLHLLLSHTGRVVAAGILIATQLPADSRRGSGNQAGDPTQAEALGMTDLNGGALFNTEFGLRHRGSTVPERSGVALSFAAAKLFSILFTIKKKSCLLEVPRIFRKCNFC